MPAAIAARLYRRHSDASILRRRASDALLSSLAATLAAERGRLVLWLPCLMVLGDVAYLGLPAEPPQWSAAVACVAVVGLGPALWRSVCGRALAVALLAVCSGFASGQWATWRALPLLDVPSRAVTVSGEVAAVEALPQGERVTIAAPVLTTADGSSRPAARDVRVRLRKTDPVSVGAGDSVRVRALLSRPSPPAYPGGWDLRRDAFFAGLGAYGFALGPASVTARAAPSLCEALLERWREAIARRVRTVLSGAEAGIAVTLLTGSAAGIASADKDAFRNSGLAHLLAIAGLHIGIVMGLLFGAVRFGIAAVPWAALHWPGKAIAALAALLAGGVYMLLTGAHLPIIRSFTMACLFTLGVLTGRQAVSLRGWALAMATLVVIAPNEVLGVSFQMSFAAVLALIAGYEALRPWLRRVRALHGWRGWLGGHVAALALTSALAGTASAPYGAYHFGQVQLYFVLANVAAVPLTALWVMPLGLSAILLMPLHAEAVALIPMGWGEDLLLWIGRSVSALPDAALRVPRMADWGLAAVSLGLLWLGLWRTRWRLLGVGGIAAGLLSPLLAPPPDLLMSADARLIAVRARPTPLMQARSGAAAFTKESWAQLWTADALQPLPGFANTDRLFCDDVACRWRSEQGALVWVARAQPRPEACRAAVILAAEPVRLSCPEPSPVLVDRFGVWRDGAHAIWLGRDGVRVVSERSLGGIRPWSPLPGHAHTTAGLAMAPAETLPPE